MSAPARIARAALAVLAALAVAGAQAQSTGRPRSRTDSAPGGQERSAPPARPLQAADPVIALERELPSLRADLRLDAAQLALWGPFERGVRDAAELTRQKAKKLLAPRPADAPPPNALGLVTALAADERMRADAMGEAATRLKALYEALDAGQRGMVDRRVLLSQSEPLGTQ